MQAWEREGGEVKSYKGKILLWANLLGLDSVSCALMEGFLGGGELEI